MINDSRHNRFMIQNVMKRLIALDTRMGIAMNKIKSKPNTWFVGQNVCKGLLSRFFLLDEV